MSTRTIIEEKPGNIAVLDVFSKLIQERIIFIDGEIDDELANGVIAQMMYLNSQSTDREIDIYINTPGGMVTQGLAIYDVAKLIKAPIRTLCIGQAASMGAILMLMGSTRRGLPHSRFMLHQISGSMRGSLEDMKISFEEGKIAQDSLYKILREKTTIPDLDKTLLTDFWMSSEEALSYGILTEIL